MLSGQVSFNSLATRSVLRQDSSDPGAILARRQERLGRGKGKGGEEASPTFGNLTYLATGPQFLRGEPRSCWRDGF